MAWSGKQFARLTQCIAMDGRVGRDRMFSERLEGNDGHDRIRVLKTPKSGRGPGQPGVN